MGFFMTPSLGAEGFGFYRMNLDAFFDPNRWSWIVPDLPSSPGDYEGLVFPGLGVLLLLVGGIVVGLRRLGGVLSPRWLPLFVVALAMACFALSDKIILGHTELFTIPLPQKLVDFFSMFRASGRMVWLAGYLVVLLAFMLLAGRLKPRTLAAVAAIAIVVQIADTSRGWTEFETTQVEPSASWPTPIHSPFWMFAARHYDKIRAIPVSGLNKKWAELSYFAAFHGMASDAAYLGRKDKKGFERLQSLASLAMTEGRFEPDALYVLDAPSAAIATRYMEPGDLLTEVDGFILFARGGKALADAEHVAVVPYAPTTLAASE